MYFTKRPKTTWEQSYEIKNMERLMSLKLDVIEDLKMQLSEYGILHSTGEKLLEHLLKLEGVYFVDVEQQDEKSISTLD